MLSRLLSYSVPHTATTLGILFLEEIIQILPQKELMEVLVPEVSTPLRTQPIPRFAFWSYWHWSCIKSVTRRTTANIVTPKNNKTNSTKSCILNQSHFWVSEYYQMWSSQACLNPKLPTIWPLKKKVSKEDRFQMLQQSMFQIYPKQQWV